MRVARVIVALVVILGVLLGVRLYQQNAELHGPAGGAGVIEGTSVVVSARLSARVTAVQVKEGAQVQAGDLLLTLDCEEAQAMLSEAQARLDASRAQAEAALASAAATKHVGKASAAAAKAARAQAAALASQRDAAQRQAARLDTLAADVPDASRDQALAQAQALERQAASARAAGQASGLQAGAATDQASAADFSAQAAASAVRAGEAAVQRAQLMVGECKVTAPAPGYVETLPYQVGELVGPGAVLARIVDTRQVTATFYLPNAEIGAVSPGASARVEADAWPSEVFVGQVTTVAMTAEFTPRNIQTRSDRDRLVYPVEVSIPNPDSRLRPGMPVQVTLDSVRQ